MAASQRPYIDVADDFPDVDQFHVANKEEGYYYCWLNKKPDNIERMKTIYGYEIINDTSPESALVPPNAAGERVNGDLILARMPMARYEKLMERRKRRNEAQEASASDQFKESVERSGATVVENTRKSQKSSLV